MTASLGSVIATVDSVDALAADVVVLRLRIGGGAEFSYQAGQYVNLDLGDGVSRSFSVACAPMLDRRLEFHIRLHGEDITQALRNIKAGAKILVGGPFGQLMLRPGTRPIIMVAGGTGFAPIKALIEQYRDERRRSPVHLYWGVRSREDLYLDALPVRWASDMAQFRYTPVLSAPKPGDNWPGRTGWVHDAVIADYPMLEGFDIYAAGPPPMVIALRNSALSKGLLAKNFFSDFAALD